MPDLLDHAATIRPGEELDVDRLRVYLRAHLTNDTSAISVSQFPAGHSNLTYLLGCGGRKIVLRRPPFGSTVKSAHDMGREFRVLSKLHAVYAPAPEVILYCEDQSILGAPFYLMEHIEGVILREHLPHGLVLSSETAKELSESFLDNLVTLHRVDYVSAGLGDLGRPQGYLERQVQGWTGRYAAAKTHEYSHVEAIARWMEQHLPESHAVSLVHNDYKYDNVLLDSEDITRIKGLLDWEMCTIGDSLTDLGMALAYWVDPNDPAALQQSISTVTTLPGSLTRAALVERYAEQTSTDVSAIAFYLTFARFKLAVILQQIYFRFHQGMTKDLRFAALPAKVEALLEGAWLCAQTGQI